MSVFITNVDDFIAPSQACINPLVASKVEALTSTPKPSKVSLQIDLSQSEFQQTTKSITRPNLIRAETSAASSTKVASVSLNDCLACSGCITSAEAVLINQQSYDKLLEALESQSPPTVIVAVSPQSLASLADLTQLPCAECFLRLASIFKVAGVKYVIDSSCAGDIALRETRDEFVFRLQHNNSRNNCDNTTNGEGNSSKSTSQKWVEPASLSSAASSTRINIIHGAGNLTDENFCGYPLTSPTSLPMFVSSCPGWICYAEKTHPQIIPYLSTTKSSQQILGSIIKRVFAPWILSSANPPADKHSSILSSSSSMINGSIMLVSVQPCFDRKLEAARLDFFHDDINQSEVDLVLSTTECWQLLEKLMIRLERRPITPMLADTITFDYSNVSHTSYHDVVSFVKHTPCDSAYGADSVEWLLRSFSDDGTNLVHAADKYGGSGAYVEHLCRYIRESLSSATSSSSLETSSSVLDPSIYLKTTAPGPSSINMSGTSPAAYDLPYKQGRNADIAEVDLTSILTSQFESTTGQQVIASVATSSTSSSLESIQLPILPNKSIKNLYFSRVYGFRNIQTILLKLKRSRLEMDFIEVMACPSGCLNGGGQIKLSERESQNESRERVASVERKFNSRRVRSVDSSPLVRFLYEGVLTNAPDDINTNGNLSVGITTTDNLKLYNLREKIQSALSFPLTEPDRRMLFHTRYHAIPKLEQIAPLAAKW